MQRSQSIYNSEVNKLPVCVSPNVLFLLWRLVGFQSKFFAPLLIIDQNLKITWQKPKHPAALHNSVGSISLRGFWDEIKHF